MTGKVQIATAMILFAKKHALVIHPLIGCDYFVKNLILLHACACAPDRKNCPCMESLAEVRERGKCKCGLYWKDFDCYLAWDPTRPDKILIEEKTNGY